MIDKIENKSCTWKRKREIPSIFKYLDTNV